MSGFSVSSWNVRGLNDKLKRRTVLNKCKNYDIICLQETFITDLKYLDWSKEWDGDFIYSKCTNHSKGQIILLNKNLKFDSFNVCIKTDRILGIKINMGNIVLYVFNIYAPVKSKTVRLEFIKELHNIFPDFNENNHILVCGDFNTVVDNNMDIIDT